MEKYDAIEYLEKLEKGKFCTVNIPVTNNQKIPVTAMFLGKDKSGRYKFLDTGRFVMPEKMIQEYSISIDENYDRNKAKEIYLRFKRIVAMRKRKKNMKHKEQSKKVRKNIYER